MKAFIKCKFLKTNDEKDRISKDTMADTWNAYIGNKGPKVRFDKI